MTSRSKKISVAATVAAAALAAVGTYDLLQKKRAVLRNYPIVGHARYMLQKIRPEIQQYFIERDWDGRPFNRTTREMIYDRAANTKSEEAFGSLRDVQAPGAEWLVHSVTPLEPPKVAPRVTIGGPDCVKPYDMALMNVSAMSFGALSAHAINALNSGAHKGGFAHDTGEGGISPYHRQGGGDLVWEIGSGYFGARTKVGNFSPEAFAEKSGRRPGQNGLAQAQSGRQAGDRRGAPQ